MIVYKQAPSILRFIIKACSKYSTLHTIIRNLLHVSFYIYQGVIESITPCIYSPSVSIDVAHEIHNTVTVHSLKFYWKPARYFVILKIHVTRINLQGSFNYESLF